MKDYKTRPNPTNRMSDDPLLRELLRKTISDNSIEGVIESGTYDGLGSTTMIAEAFRGLAPPKFFCTCDVNLSKYKRARKNLAKYPFVTCLWGRSVTLTEAIEFMQNDEMLNHHERYPDLFIDWTEHPAWHYLEECKRGFMSHKRALGYYLRAPLYHLLGIARYQGEDLLRRLLNRHVNEKVLIVLDSAGGTGFLEFKIVAETMNNQAYWLLLDDINHIKHYRSFERIKSDPSFRLLGFDPSRGWALARHTQPLPAPVKI